MSAFSDFGVPGLILCRPIDAYESSDDFEDVTADWHRIWCQTGKIGTEFSAKSIMIHIKG